MSITLPNSPIRKVYRCIKCNNVSIKFWDDKYDRSYTTDEWMTIKRCLKCNNLSIEFWNSKYNRSYTVEEWLTICEDGKEALRKILQPVMEDPKFFLD